MLQIEILSLVETFTMGRITWSTISTQCLYAFFLFEGVICKLEKLIFKPL